ncbi:DUF664 domain-containing protein [Actinopolymorpha sp. B17G11]|uniref:mycothiol transferase n=1 Tax=unclassified Actinopolymorpha TaxID=2627063 RepID=UPI0032E477DE
MDWTDLPFTDSQQGTDAEILCFALERVHKQFAWKTGGLNAEQLRRQHPPSTMTLAGLIKHMASVEDAWTAKAHGRSPNLPWNTDDWDGGEYSDFHSALTDEPEELYALWYGVVKRSRAAWQEMIEHDGLDVTVTWSTSNGEPYIVSRRRLLVDLLEENLKHTGHADLLREAVDGLKGNDPPW